MKMRHAMRADRPAAYLAACTIYRDAADYLAEWVEVHLLMGVERFFLYDNGSTDHHRDVLAPYVEEGRVEIHDWPTPFLRERGRPRAMVTAFEHCVRTYVRDARWIAFLDVDEFLFSPTGMRLSEVLRDYEQHPGVVVSRAEFGPSGHVTRPPGLVIENYLQRVAMGPDGEAWIKSIADPRRVSRCLGSHSFVYRDGWAVDEDGRPLDPLRFRRRKPVSWDRLRVHHYRARSEEERLRKAEIWRAIGSERRPPPRPAAASRHPVTDDTLARHAPKVRAALARRGLELPPPA
jgi:Glycosyltransferase family 92